MISEVSGILSPPHTSRLERKALKFISIGQNLDWTNDMYTVSPDKDLEDQSILKTRFRDKYLNSKKSVRFTSTNSRKSSENS
jgi:hypothetical protein